MKIAFTIFCLLLPGLVRAGSVTLAWDASASSDIAFYTLTYGQYGQFEDQAVSIAADAINQDGTSYQITLSPPDGILYEATVTSTNTSGISSLPSNLVVFQTDRSDPVLTPIAPLSTFFAGAVYLGNGVSYLSFANGSSFGYYATLSDPRYVYHFDMGYEYIFDANDGRSGVYFYDFASGSFFYTSPSFPFPYLYDFSLGTVLYYYPDPNNPGRYNTGSVRYFYRFDTGQIITK